MVPFEVDRETGVAEPVVLARAVGFATADAEEPAREDRRRKVRYRSTESSGQRPPGGCCEWYSEWGKMQGWG